jgi:hydrogenase maturation factor
MSEIHEECLAQGIAVAGGHTEFNDRYERPVIMGALIGTADRVLRANELRPGDALIVTKHIGIEGMSILATDKPELLKPFMSEADITEMVSWAEKTSVLEESKVLRKIAKFMHDPTEGGFMGGIGEISALSGLRTDIDYASVPVHPLTARAAEKLGFDPLRLIASGSLIAAVPGEKTSEALRELAKLNIDASVVGSMGEKLQDPVPEPSEELWRLLKMGGAKNG